MPRDRLTWIIIPLAVLGLVLSIFWQQQEAEKARALAQLNHIATPAQVSPSPTATPLPQTEAPATSPAAPAVPEQKASLKSEVANLHFSNNRGGVNVVELLQHRAEDDNPVVLNSPQAPGIGAIARNPNDWRDTGYTLAEDPVTHAVTLTKDAGNNIQIAKTFSVGQTAGLQDPYQFKLAIKFQNTGSTAQEVPGFFVSTGSAQPMHATDRSTYTTFNWYRDGRFQSVPVTWFDAGHLLGFLPIQTSPPHEIYSETGDHIMWAAVADQYFVTILQSLDKSGTQVWARRDPVSAEINPRAWSIQGALGFSGFTLQPGETNTKEFAIYAGPKEYGRLSRLGGDLNAVVNFGPPFGFISQILLTSMNTLHAFVGSYGVAIIIMTLIIRLLLWPVQNYSMKSMRRMAKLSPIVNELKVKYKDDPQRMNQEMMKLYKEYGINPLTGCLPMLIQIPIFFGFYAMLGSAVELRNSSFLWVRDLSQPDTIGHVLGFPINIIPLIMAATQLWQLRITPKTGDPSQQRVLLVMPIVFLFICYNFASALALYYTVQNLFLIGQTYLTRNQAEPQLTKPVKAQAVAKKKSYR
ncbi:MAG: membrane protein insertase YidC [Verrucomicrobia bacterium]|nr:membrane protein insertase YidC [Verrucomicrobiota bacterium]